MFKPDGQPFKQVRFTSQSSSCWQATCVSIQGGSAGAVILTDLSGIPHAPSNWNHQSSPIWNHHQPNTTIKRTCSLKNHWWWLEIVMFFWGDIFVNIYIYIFYIYIYIFIYICVYIYIMYMCIYIYIYYVYVYIYILCICIYIYIMYMYIYIMYIYIYQNDPGNDRLQPESLKKISISGFRDQEAYRQRSLATGIRQGCSCWQPKEPKGTEGTETRQPKASHNQRLSETQKYEFRIW